MNSSQAPQGGAIILALAWLAAAPLASAAETGDTPAGRADAERPAPVAYAIRIEGNAMLGDRALRGVAADELRELHRHGLRRADADDAAFEMTLAYRAAGYAFATVDYRIDAGPGKPVVTFTVTEGPRVHVERIDLVGNAAFPTGELLRHFAAPRAGILGMGEALFVETEIQAGVADLRGRYFAEGYLDAQVDKPAIAFSPDRTRANVTLRIHEGMRYRIREITFAGDLLPEVEPLLAEVRKQLREAPYYPRRKLALRSRVLEAYGNLGYPEATVDIDERRAAADGGVVLAATIASGPLATVGEIAVEGNRRTRTGVIRRRVPFQPGDRYRLYKQREAFQSLYRTGLFSKVDLAFEPLSEGDVGRLTVRVEEAPSKELYLEPGWGSYELLRLRGGFRERNLFGTGRIFGVEASASAKALGLTVNLTDPWFLDSDITADLPITYRRRKEPSFTRREVGAALLLSKRLTDHWTVTAGYGYQATELTEVAVDTAAEALDTGYDLASVKVQATYDTRDDLFFPSHGQRSFVAAERADRLLGGSITLTRLTAGTRVFTPLGEATILGLRYATGLILPGGAEVTVPLGERFFNGGENTVRSFAESQLGPLDVSGDPAGGLAYNVITVELRRRLRGNLAGSLFFDYGNVAPNRTRSEQGEEPYDSRAEIVSDTLSDYWQDFRPAVGAGVQYLLPVGPARLDFAFNPDARTERGEDGFVWHFSVGMAF